VIEIKRCKHCTRTQIRENFYVNRHGQLSARCRDCHRANLKAWYRNKYRTNEEFREKEKARFKALYYGREAYRKNKIAKATVCKRRNRQGGIACPDTRT
jgi:hypothetical protein